MIIGLEHYGTALNNLKQSIYSALLSLRNIDGLSATTPVTTTVNLQYSTDFWSWYDMISYYYLVSRSESYFFKSWA